MKDEDEADAKAEVVEVIAGAPAAEDADAEGVEELGPKSSSKPTSGKSKAKGRVDAGGHGEEEGEVEGSGEGEGAGDGEAAGKEEEEEEETLEEICEDKELSSPNLEREAIGEGADLMLNYSITRKQSFGCFVCPSSALTAEFLASFIISLSFRYLFSLSFILPSCSELNTLKMPPIAFGSCVSFQELACSVIHVNQFVPTAAIVLFRNYSKQLVWSPQQLNRRFDLAINRDYFCSCSKLVLVVAQETKWNSEQAQTLVFSFPHL